MRNRGFTLLEMLVALGVFAVIGVMSSQILMQMIDIADKTTDRGERLMEIQRALDIMARDFEQLTYRAVRDELGDPGLDLMIDPTRTELTRRGWVNPLGMPRSELQRIAYVFEAERLNRYFWPVLDRAPDSEPVYQTLLEGVSAVEFTAIDISANEHGFWPLLGEYAADPESILAAVQVSLAVEPYGEVNRIWSVPFSAQRVIQIVEPGGEGPEQGDEGAQSGTPDTPTTRRGGGATPTRANR